MEKAKEVISRFYTAFSNLDSTTMNTCYTDDVVFFDPVFDLLRGDEVRCMWVMLCRSAKNFTLSFDNIIDLGDDYYTCDWVAGYDFSKTGRRVTNKVRANMKIIDGIIMEHSDAYSMHKWAAQALGFPGWLLGWNSFFQRKIKNKAKKNLLQFMQEI